MSDPHSAADAVAAFEMHEPIDHWCKGAPIGGQWPQPVTVATLRDSARTIFGGGLRTPFATLRSTALAVNLAAMTAFCTEHHLLLAPHAKTAMSPQLVAAQLASGAWGMTAALPVQVERLWDFGVHRVLLANEVADADAMERLGGGLQADPRRELLLMVDSARGVDSATAGLSHHADVGVDVLIDVGHEHGRTGVRSMTELDSVADAVTRAAQLRLVGVGGYEGTIGTARGDGTVDRVDAFLRRLADSADRLQERGQLAVDRPVVSAGGSVWFDRVAAVLGPLARDGGADVVLRSGCYVTHDHGLYATSTPHAAASPSAPRFAPALEVWARVVSRPEPGLLLVDAGRRDLSHDAGLPTPLRGHQHDGGTVELSGAHVSALSDQHAFVVVSDDTPLQVGDLLALGISHPCTTFDRWPLLLTVDDTGVVVGAVRTYF